MARRALGLLSLTALLLSAFSAEGQKLPTGAKNTVRDRSFDLLHLKAELRLEPAKGTVSGVASLEIEPLALSETICLDGYSLEVREVESGNSDALPFDNDGRQICVKLPATAKRGERLGLRILYSAKPRAGMYFQADPEREGLYFVTTYGEGGLHANWLPIYNAPNDKFSSEMIITVPAPHTIVSNGILVSKSDTKKGESTFHWLQERPHSDYLIALYMGDFERGELAPAFGTIPLAYWVPRGRLAEGAHAFRNTTRMVEVFSERFDYRYPWVVYDQLAIPDYAVGAMEHTGITGHDASMLRFPGQAPTDFSNPDFSDYHTDWTAEAIIAHELAHHWFGNDVTCAHLGQIWLNESFASYLMMLWAESDQGADQLAFDVDHARGTYFDFVDEDHMIRPLAYDFFDSPNDIYNQPHTYFKGAAILHMLRGVLGDEAFFQALSSYLHSHAMGLVDDHDLAAAIQASTGRNVDWFFEDWISGGGHPQLEVRSRYLAGRKLLDLTVRQVQPMVEGQGLFHLPVTLTLETEEGSRTETIWIDQEEDRFLIPLATEPSMVSFDGAGYLVAEIDFPKDLDELLYQVEHDALAGRLRALRRLAQDFPAHPRTLQLFESLLAEDSAFWGLRAEATILLPRVPAPASRELALGILNSKDERLRTAAVLALANMGPAAEDALHNVLKNEPHADVVATALVALAKNDAKVERSVLTDLLARKSWNDELKTAVAAAIGEWNQPELLDLVRPLTAFPHNQETRGAALTTWAKIAPEDPRLHKILLDLASSPSYVLQQHALEALGDLLVMEAKPILKELAEIDVDANLTQLAKAALEELARVEADMKAH